MNIKDFEVRLLKEKEGLEKTLSSVSSKNPAIPGDWEAKYPDLNVDPSDKSDMADEVEEYDKNLGINSVLEERLREIESALDRIKKNSFGKCEICQRDLEPERLDANPSARTCIEHTSNKA